MGLDDGVPIYYSLAEVQSAVLTVCTVPMSTEMLTAAGRIMKEQSGGTTS